MKNMAQRMSTAGYKKTAANQKRAQEQRDYAEALAKQQESDRQRLLAEWKRFTESDLFAKAQIDVDSHAIIDLFATTWEIMAKRQQRPRRFWERGFLQHFFGRKEPQFLLQNIETLQPQANQESGFIIKRLVLPTNDDSLWGNRYSLVIAVGTKFWQHPTSEVQYGVFVTVPNDEDFDNDNDPYRFVLHVSHSLDKLLDFIAEKLIEYPEDFLRDLWKINILEFYQWDNPETRRIEEDVE